MADIYVPQLGESVVEATVGHWHKQVGDTINVGDILVDLETDKVDIEVGAEAAGVLSSISRKEGEDVEVGDVLGVIDGNGAPVAKAPAVATVETAVAEAPAAAPAAEAAKGTTITPVAKRMADAQGVDISQLSGSGPGGRITKDDVQNYQPAPAAPVAAPASTPAPVGGLPPIVINGRSEREERMRMSRRRRTIASRLVEAQQTAAMLTTFNEIDMSAVMTLRKKRQEAFVKRYDIKVGFTSFFVKATIGALKAFPRLNAEIQGDEMVLKRYYDIGIAVGAEEGLVVPVLRDADRQSFAEIERNVKGFAKKSREGSLTLDDLVGGTFTITNGGVFGSMLSTPILNRPQVGILGLHNIKERPVVIDGEVAVRPIMYVALTYDHRIVDGREAVQFLVRVKELIEDPESLLLEG